jgi:hypothetical protein
MFRLLIPILGLAALAACAGAVDTPPQEADGLRHVVVFKYRAGTTDEQIRQVTEAFRGLQDRIPGIVAFEHGVNDSPEGRDLGFTHVYLMTFADAAARDSYLPHPEHQEFGRMLGGMNVLEDVFVVDYLPER